MLLAACAWLMANPEVQIFGALREIMHEGDLSARVMLAEHVGPGSYALGALADLKGEILVLDGKVTVSRPKGETLTLSEDGDVGAALLVSARVEAWMRVPIAGMADPAILGDFVETAVKHAGLDPGKPIPFRIEGRAKSVSWHVIDWPEGDTEHSHAKHKQAGLQGREEQVEVVVLGFWSKHHQGIFTHRDRVLHMHVAIPERGIAGHVDALEPGPEMTLWVPAP